METAKLTETEIINFPTTKELEVVSWVNTANILVRNAKAKAYSQSCKRKTNHEELWCALSSLSILVVIIAAYFIMFVM